MQTSKVYIHKNPEGMWEVGTLVTVKNQDDELELVYVNKHEASSQPEAMKWVENNYSA